MRLSAALNASHSCTKSFPVGQTYQCGGKCCEGGGKAVAPGDDCRLERVREEKDNEY